MLRKRYSVSRIFLLAMLLSSSVGSLSAQDISGQYKKYFVKFADNRSIMEKAFNAAGLTNEDVGRSFALICGISKYPNMRGPEGNLEPAAEDVRKLKEHLQQKEFFDEIVVLENADVTLENLTYFLQSYFPKRLEKFPKSRFLFAYSGHGMTEHERGYLLESTADSLKDRAHSINLDVLHSLVKEVVLSGHQVLVLQNSCYGGAFLKRTYGGETLIPKYPGAHAITAGESGELTWHDASLGKGSVFYEKIIAGLSGIADTQQDGIITAHELAAYLINEIRVFTDQKQNPQLGDISLNGSRGEFFFLNKDTQVAEVKGGKAALKTSFGDDAKKLFEEGKRLYDKKKYNEALSLFRLAAEAGNTDGMYWLAHLYAGGNGVRKDFVQAMIWYKKAADKGNADAMACLGDMYDLGWGVKKNAAEGEKWRKKAAEGGSTYAMFMLAWMTDDPNEQMKWYKKVAEAGDSYGMYYVGFMYVNNKDYDNAAKWYKKSADAGNSNGMVALGFMYENGNGVAKDYKEAVKWYRKAAESGNFDGMNNLGVMYQNGTGVVKDDAEAVKWYRKAAESGSFDGMVALGNLYIDGNGVAKDYTEAVKLYRKAAEAGNAAGMNNLGCMYFNGKGVAKDYNEAIKWCRKAADAGNAEGMNMLGAASQDNKDYANAATWYLKAAEAGSPVGMNKIGFFYENGTGVAKDYDEAVKWYRKSAEAGDADGMLNLDLMYKAGKISSNDYNEAVRLYQQNSANSSVRITSPISK